MCIIRGFFVKGFIVDELFVVKEVAILRNGREMTHYVVMCPMPWRFLTKKDQSHASWLMAHHHGLRWNDGMVPYRMVQRLITEAVNGQSDDYDALIYVKGLEKRGWLMDIIKNDNIIVETIDNHFNDIESLENLDSNNTFRCGRHKNCCALQNAMKLYNQYQKYQNE